MSFKDESSITQEKYIGNSYFYRALEYKDLLFYEKVKEKISSGEYRVSLYPEPTRKRWYDETVPRNEKERFNKFPDNVNIIRRIVNRDFCIKNRGNYEFESVYTLEWGILELTYFKENIIIEIKNYDEEKTVSDSIREKVAESLNGKIIGDNKLISVPR